MSENTTVDPVRQGRRAVSFWLGWLGVVLGAISAASAIVEIFDIGLQPALERIVSLYRTVVSPVRYLINLAPWPFDFPDFAVDLVVLYLLMVAAALRAFFIFASTKYEGPEESQPIISLISMTILCVVAAPYVVITLVFQNTRTFFSKSPEEAARYVDELRAQGHPSDFFIFRYYRNWLVTRRTERLIRIQIIALPAAIALFFVINAFASSA